MYFICANLIKYENGKLSQSEMSRCSHLEFNRGVPVCGRRVGGRWEIFHIVSYLPSKQMYHFGKHCRTLCLMHLELLEATEKVGEVGNVLSCVSTELYTVPQLSKSQRRWEPWPTARTWLDGVWLKSPTSLAQSSAEKQSAAEGIRIEVSPAPLFKNELVKEKERH